MNKYKVKIKNPIFGVPISFLSKYCEEQFEIVGNADDKSTYPDVFGNYIGRITLDGNQPFKRLFIKHKTQNNEI